MIQDSQIIYYIMEMAKKERDKIKDVIIENIIDIKYEEYKEDNPVGFWEVRHTVDEVIDNTEYDLCKKGFIEIDYENRDIFNEIIDNFNIDIRDEIFQIIIEPIVKHFENDYIIKIDKFWEEVRFYEK